VRLVLFSSRRRHTRSNRDWSTVVCSSDLSYFRLGGCFLCSWFCVVSRRYFSIFFADIGSIFRSWCCVVSRRYFSIFFVDIGRILRSFTRICLLVFIFFFSCSCYLFFLISCS